MPTFGERLRSLRTSKNLSQMDFAKQIKVSKSSVNMYERDEREPGFETLERIADYFNVDLDYLLGKSDYTCKIQPCTDTVPYITDSERLLLKKFRALDERGKSAVLNVLDHEYNSLPGIEANTASKEA